MNRGSRWRSNLLGKTGLALAVATLTLALWTGLRTLDPAPLVTARELTFDWYQRVSPRVPPPDLPIRVVDIDEASLRILGQWPWPRTRMAEMVRRLTELGAAAIAFDIIFAEPDRTSPLRYAERMEFGGEVEESRILALFARLPDHDRQLAAAMAASQVVIGFAALADANATRPPAKAGIAYGGSDPAKILEPFSGATTNIEVLDQAASGVGSVSLSRRDSSGVVRRVPLLLSDGEKVYPSLVIEALRVAQGQPSLFVRSTGASGEADTGRPALVGLRVGEFQIPLTATGELWIHYDHDQPKRYVSALNLFEPDRDEVLRPLIEGQIVFVGTSAVGLRDNRTTALGEIVPGVSIHAQAAEQILTGSFLSRPDWAEGLEITATVLLGALITALLLLLGSYASMIVGAFVAGLAIVGSWYAFTQFGLLIDAILPSLGALGVYLTVMGTLYVLTDREKRFVRQAFKQYLAPELLTKLEQTPRAMKLGGEVRPMTILFMDVRDFTPISETLSATDLVNFLNALLSPLSDAIQAEHGTIDKYIGDSVMAFWNAPLDVPDHPARACRAALAMRGIVSRMNAEDAFGFRAAGRPDLIVRIGVGINTGEACVGNMGSTRRFNYSVVGDAVNTAARVESSCKGVGADLLVSERTARAVPGFAMLEAGEIALKGKAVPEKLFVLVGDERHASSAQFQALSSSHANLISAIAAGNPAEASRALEISRSLGGPLLQTFYDGFEQRIRLMAPSQHRAPELV